MSDNKTNQKKKWVPPSNGSAASVDNGVFDKINTILNDDATSQLPDFFAKGFGNQAISSWSYYAQVNDHRKFTNATITITKLLNLLSGHHEFHENGVQIIKEILTSYIKTIYRGLNSLRASMTNPMLRLINEIVLFKNGALLDDFVALFDFTLPVLPKLLNPTKTELSAVEATKEKEHLSIRYCMIRLLLNILKYSTPFLRKEFLSNNHKLLVNWFKFICVIDSNSLISLTLSIWEEKIIKEQSFKKATKVKVFNDWNITKLIPIYYTKDKELRSTLDKFVVSIATDTKYGLKFSDDETWFLNTTSSGTISVNGKWFKTHNKLLYSLITSMKPWDDDLQLNTTVEILKHSPELIPPFVNYLASRGLHDPKLSSYWLGQTLLISKLMKIAIPNDISKDENTAAPSTDIVLELIVPSVLNRAVLSRCITSDSFMIKHLSAQLIVTSLQKLEEYMNLYHSKGWSEQSIQLISKVKLSLPEISTVVTSFTDVYTKKSDNKLLLLIFLTIINFYTKILSDTYNLSQQISKPYSDIINQAHMKGIDFVLLDNFFQLQEGENSQVKWWNKTDKSTSLFTSLLKIASSNESSTSSLSSKVTTLLSNLVDQTVIFDKETANADQTQLLVASLKLIQSSDSASGEQLEKIWKLLDESVSRCVRSPFKYLDASNANELVSPLVMTLFEQWKFVDKTTPYDLVSKWFLVFLRYIIIAGESPSAIRELLETIEITVDAHEYLPLVSEPSFSKENPLHGYEEYSYFTFVTSAPINKLQNISKIPTSHLDIVGSFFRLHQIFSDDYLAFNNGLKQSIVEILTKVGNHLFGNPDEVVEFSKQKYWSQFFDSKVPNEKASFISSTLAEIFSQLPNFNTHDFQNITFNKIAEGSYDDSVIAATLWALDNEQLLHAISGGTDLVKLEALSSLFSRKTSIKASLAADILSDDRLTDLICDFIANRQVEFDDVNMLLNVISSNTKLLSLFGSLAKEERIMDQLLAHINAESDPAIISIVFSSISEKYLSTISDTDLFSDLAKTAKNFAVENIKKEDFSVISFDSCLQILNHPSLNLSQEEKDIVIEYSLTKNNHKYTSEVAKAIQSFGSFEDSTVKIWANKASLYITRGFAELNESSTSFNEFVQSYKTLLLKSNLIQSTNRTNLNALLETIFTKRPTDESALELSAMITAVSHKSSLDTNKLLQIIAFNDDNALAKSSSPRARYLTSLIIWKLFEFDVSKNSTAALQEKLLVSYGGSPNADDLLLYKILERIETRLNASWIDSVFTWEFLDSLTEEESELIGETKLLEKKKEGFIVTLSKSQITNTIKNYTITHAPLPSLSSSGSSNWEKLNSFYDIVTSSSSSSKTYDPLFLSLLILNNDELMSLNTEEADSSPKVDLRKLIESDIFPFLLMNLSSENEALVQVTFGVLSTILSSLEENSTFKDKHIFELFLSKILYTFRKVDENGEKITAQNFSPLVFSLISKISTILVNPGHLLYEKAFRWVLKSPTLRQNEIPLFNDITVVSATNDDSSNYYKQVSWLLDGINTGIKNKSDTRLLRSKNIYEWFMNLQASPYTSAQLQFLIIEFVKQVQSIEDGADILMSRYGGLSYIEQQVSEKITDASILTGAQSKLVNQQELLNLKELGVRYSIVGEGKKRIADWATDDLPNFYKRLQTQK